MTNRPTRIGNYRLVRRIGKGGMSEIWLARHRSLETQYVAIKLLMSQDQEWIDRFMREASITSRLKHEHIVQVYDHGEQPPFHYTVIEYIQGGALRDLLQEHQRLSLEQAIHVFRSAGVALDYAHTHNVIHRDVSPGNILVEQNTGRVLLTDFGIAREVNRGGMTTVSKVMGTPGYLSPEHATSATSVTHLSDLFSLGVVLFEMLSGRLPWDHNPGMPDSTGGPFTPIKTLQECGVTGLPPEVDRVLQILLAVEPNKRYPNAQAAIDELESILERHTSSTQVVGGSAAKTMMGATAQRLNNVPPEPHPVETVLGPNLLRAPIEEARKRAESLANGHDLRELLDGWSRNGRLRLHALGRQANIKQVSSANVYFYTLRVLYETREPVQTTEEPDRAPAAPPPMERTQDRWSVALPALAGFDDDPGGVVPLPGSVRVTACEQCKGIGRTPCPGCKGQGRIKVIRDVRGVATVHSAAASEIKPAASAASAATAAAPPTTGVEVLVPCPECTGTGALRCERCEGVGRMLEKKTVQWRRAAASFANQDPLAKVDKDWLLKACRLTEVYREQHIGEPRPEWEHVPVVKELFERARAQLDDNTTIAMSEVAISFIPITDMVFDLGDGSASQPEAEKPASNVYRWSVYGFERVLPNDWRFLNWDRIAALAVGIWAMSLLLVLVLFLIRTGVI